MKYAFVKEAQMEIIFILKPRKRSSIDDNKQDISSLENNIRILNNFYNVFNIRISERAQLRLSHRRLHGQQDRHGIWPGERGPHGRIEFERFRCRIKGFEPHFPGK